jgi:hypothetical protein
MPSTIPMRLDPLFDGTLESSDEETRSDPEHHETIGGLQRRDQPHAAGEHYVAITQRREISAQNATWTMFPSISVSISIENSRKTTRRGVGPGGLFATWTK